MHSSNRPDVELSEAMSCLIVLINEIIDDFLQPPCGYPPSPATSRDHSLHTPGQPSQPGSPSWFQASSKVGRKGEVGFGIIWKQFRYFLVKLIQHQITSLPSGPRWLAAPHSNSQQTSPAFRANPKAEPLYTHSPPDNLSFNPDPNLVRYFAAHFLAF